MTNQLVMTKKSRSRFTTAKVARAIGIFVLGCVVFATKHAIQQQMTTDGDPANMVRRSAEVVYNSIQQKQDKQPSESISQKLKMEPKDDFSLAKRYIIEAIPSAYVNKQNPKIKSEFESRLKKRNVTRWQYPDFVHVPLTDLGVVFLNGQRFYQQGAGTPPEYRANGTSADTRAVGDHKCPGKGAGAGNKDKTPKFMMRAMLNDAIQPAPPAQQVGCCNGQPYNTNKRCCCRRASFDKDTKFCCAVDGCRNFQIFKRNDPKAIEKCHALEGVVVQEYGYH